MSRNPQPSLDLQKPSGWGGRRPGAGRKAARDARILHRSREGLGAQQACHVTLKVRPEVPSLRSVRLVRELERSFAGLRQRRDFRLVHYALQGNHAHLIVEAKDPEALGRGMKALGARLARAVNRTFRRKGPVLADRYHLRVLRTPKEVRNALAYVLLNARRHARKASRICRCDPASSGRWFDGWRRRPEVPRLQERLRSPPVARARSWLLRAGWRRHGLIDPLEVPRGGGAEGGGK
ncbi:MAG: transposase [Deltaproteobacteria bacterium]|nr:transposase [Deltaproteobacteria bacterium]